MRLYPLLIISSKQGYQQCVCAIKVLIVAVFNVSDLILSLPLGNNFLGHCRLIEVWIMIWVSLFKYTKSKYDWIPIFCSDNKLYGTCTIVLSYCYSTTEGCLEQRLGGVWVFSRVCPVVIDIRPALVFNYLSSINEY